MREPAGVLWLAVHRSNTTVRDQRIQCIVVGAMYRMLWSHNDMNAWTISLKVRSLIWICEIILTYTLFFSTFLSLIFVIQLRCHPLYESVRSHRTIWRFPDGLGLPTFEDTLSACKPTQIEPHFTLNTRPLRSRQLTSKDTRSSARTLLCCQTCR